MRRRLTSQATNLRGARRRWRTLLPPAFWGRSLDCWRSAFTIPPSTPALTMQDAHAFLKALTIVLGVAAVTTVVFQRLRQPVVLGYIIAGLIVGPHVPIPLVADSAVVRTLSELGVILLMFSLGLEFSI